MLENIISFSILIIFAGIIIYLIFQRIKEKKKENFKDRDN